MSASDAFSHLPCVTPRSRYPLAGCRSLSQSRAAFQFVSGICEWFGRRALGSRIGQYTLICLIGRQRRRIPAASSRSVAVWCGRCDWFCVVTCYFLTSFGWTHNYRIQGVISRIYIFIV